MILSFAVFRVFRGHLSSSASPNLLDKNQPKADN
jgi:hypothetical protein